MEQRRYHDQEGLLSVMSRMFVEMLSTENVENGSVRGDSGWCDIYKKVLK